MTRSIAPEAITVGYEGTGPMRYQIEQTKQDGVLRYDVSTDGVPVSRLGFWTQLRDDPELRARLGATLAEAPFASFFWETPPLAPESGDRPFAFVLVDAPALAGVRPDRRTFAHLFGEGPVSVGPNLSGDARLVIPAPVPGHDFPDLARFSRTAPPERGDALWQAVGGDVVRWTETRSEPVWTSTSGFGVHWLHVRLDTRPKYYSYAPYRDARA